MIKVVHVLTDTNIGGAGKCLLAFLDNYDKAELAVEVILPENSALKAEIDKRGVPCTEAPHLADRAFDCRAVATLYKLFKNSRPNIVHTHAALSARITARLYGIGGKCKIVHTRHSVFDPPKPLTHFPLKPLHGALNNALSDHIIAVSPAAMQNMVATGTHPDQITVVYNGINAPPTMDDTAKAAVRRRYGLVESDFVLAIIARLEAVKGHDIILDAAKMLAKDDIGIKILMAGGGTLEEHLRQRIKDEQIDNVTMAGFVSEVYEIENIMDVQLNASTGTEATSLALLEGMCLGVPAVASDFGGNPYIIKEGINGIIVPQNDAAALCEAVLKLRNNPVLYQKLSENAVADFNVHYTSRLMTKNMLKIYCALIGGDRPQQAEKKGDDNQDG